MKPLYEGITFKEMTSDMCVQKCRPWSALRFVGDLIYPLKIRPAGRIDLRYFRAKSNQYRSHQNEGVGPAQLTR